MGRNILAFLIRTIEKLTGKYSLREIYMIPETVICLEKRGISILALTILGLQMQKKNIKGCQMIGWKNNGVIFGFVVPERKIYHNWYEFRQMEKNQRMD